MITDFKSLKIHAVIPTYDRMRLIQRTVNSLFDSSRKPDKITIVVDVNEPYYKRLFQVYRNYENIEVLFNPKRLGWPKSLNRVLVSTDDDVYIYAADDIYFHKMTVELALLMLMKKWGGDGVIGFQQNLVHFCPAAFGMFGRDWVNRYPGRNVFYHKYVHFCGDSELWHYAKHINRFLLCNKCKVDHERIRDHCKSVAQRTLNSDRAIWRPRKHAKTFWPEYK